jgi:hypothetical protein
MSTIGTTDRLQRHLARELLRYAVMKTIFSQYGGGGSWTSAAPSSSTGPTSLGRTARAAR